MEKKAQSVLTPRCVEKQMDKTCEGVTEVFDVCYIRMGTFSFRQRWIQRETSESLTATVTLGVLGLGFIMGFVCGWVTANSRQYHFVALDL